MATTSAIMRPSAILGRACRLLKRRPLDLHAGRLVATVAVDVVALFAARTFHSGIRLANRRVVAFGEQLEVMDQRLHRRVQFGAGRRGNLAVAGHHGAAGNVFESLDENALALLAVLPCGTGSGRTRRPSCRWECRTQIHHSPCRGSPCGCPRRRRDPRREGPLMPQAMASSAEITPMPDSRSTKIGFLEIRRLYSSSRRGKSATNC